jgi:alcohol dehydrogenase
VKEEHLLDLAEMAAKQWTAQFNPREPSVEDFVGLYRAAL